jgi:hypothetical protein
MKIRTLAVTLWLLATTSMGFAACDSGLAGRMNAKLHPGRALDEERAACKSWPGVLGRSIVVLPLPRTDAEPGVTEFDLDILIVQQADNGNTDRSTITSRLFEQKVLIEDAVHIEDIRIDTARYPLAADARAFGVRVRYSGTSRANPYANETLMLYVPQGERLRKVLNGLEMSMDRGEWDSNCIGTFEQMRGTLSVAITRSNGFADLMLRRTVTDSHASFVDGDCVEQPQAPSLESVLLRYDGTSYVQPAAPPYRQKPIRRQ